MSALTASGVHKGPAGSPHTITALSRWSVLNTQLPDVDKIKAIHVYDFDNTLFKTPLPNPKLWHGVTIGTLANPDAFVNGGWWHDSRILAATGEGIAKEEPRAWAGWWNEKVVELVQLSIKQKDALCVLLTGRSEEGFSDLLKRMVASRGLDFHMIGLKPAVGPSNQRFASTMIFKQKFLEALMDTYHGAGEIRIYEDRPKHVKGFRDFMADHNRRRSGIGGMRMRPPIFAEVVPVVELGTYLDPVVEVAEVQHLINCHNDAIMKKIPGARGERMMIKKTVFYTGYLIDPVDTERLLALAQIPTNVSGAEIKYHANNIMICPRPCPKSILDKVGGMGHKMRWQVTGTACFENSIWAACLKPIPSIAKFHTDNPSPLVVLALRKGARPVDAGRIEEWKPVPPEKAHIFETTVGEKVVLRIEAEDLTEGAYESLFPNKVSKRKHTGDEEPHGKYHNGHHNNHHNPHGHRGGNIQQGHGPRGGRGGFRGAGRGYRTNARGGGGQARGGGGRGGKGHTNHYRSLDDLGTRDSQTVMYDDSPAGTPGYRPPANGGGGLGFEPPN